VCSSDLHAAGVAVAIAGEARGDVVREHVPAPQPRHFRVERLHVGHAAAEHDDVGVEDVDHAGQGPRQPLAVAPEVASVALERRAAEVGLDAALAPAIAVRQRKVRSGRQGQRVMSPFAGDGVGAGEDLAADRDAAADAGAEDHAEDRMRALPRAVGGLREREAVGVVLDAHLAADGPLQVLLERPADEPRRVGVLHPAVDKRQGAGNPYTDRSRSRLSYQRTDRGHGGVIVAARRHHALAQPFAPVRRERDYLDLGAAQIDAYTRHVLSVHGFCPATHGSAAIFARGSCLVQNPAAHLPGAPGGLPPALASGGAPTVELLSSADDLTRIAPQWNELHERAAAASIFNSWIWQYQWWQVYGGSQPLRILVARDESRVLGIVALYVQEAKALGRRVRLLRFVGTGADTHPDDLGPVLAAGAEQAASLALARAALRVAGVDVVLATDIDPHSPVARSLEQAAAEARAPSFTGESERIA